MSKGYGLTAGTEGKLICVKVPIYKDSTLGGGEMKEQAASIYYLIAHPIFL